MDIDDDHLRIQAKSLMEKYDNDLYDIIKNYFSFRILSKAKDELLKLLKHHPSLNDPKYIQDYRKVKLFNLFRNQIRQFTVTVGGWPVNFLFRSRSTCWKWSATSC